MKNIAIVFLLGLVFNCVGQDVITREVTINQKESGFSLYCKAKLEGLNNIDTIDAIKTDFGKSVKAWNYDPVTGQVLIHPKQFGGIVGFFNLKFMIGAATISQQIFSRPRTFFVDEDSSFPPIGEVVSITFCGQEMERYDSWGSNGILVNEFDVATLCKDEVSIIITYKPK